MLSKLLFCSRFRDCLRLIMAGGGRPEDLTVAVRGQQKEEAVPFSEWTPSVAQTPYIQSNNQRPDSAPDPCVHLRCQRPPCTKLVEFGRPNPLHGAGRNPCCSIAGGAFGHHLGQKVYLTCPVPGKNAKSAAVETENECPQKLQYPSPRRLCY